MREIKFRAFNHVSKTMYYESNIGDVFKWHNEGQVQTIMQFTGIKDKNGKDVYEGDVVQVEPKGDHPNKTPILFTVFFNEGSAVWFLSSYKKYEDQSFALPLVNPFYKSMQVVGSIHDNPELLPCNSPQ